MIGTTFVLLYVQYIRGSLGWQAVLSFFPGASSETYMHQYGPGTS